MFRKEKICVLRMTKILDNLKKNVTPRLSDKIVSELNVIINNFTILKKNLYYHNKINYNHCLPYFTLHTRRFFLMDFY